MEKIYAPWLHSQVQDLAWLSYREPKELEDIGWRISRGKPVGNMFPEGVIYDLSPEHEGVHLADSLPNIGNYYVVSEKLRGILERSTTHFEFHRIRIRNHKGRIEKAPYYMANLLDVVDCMDKSQSDYTESALAPTEASTIRRLVLDHDKIPDNAQIFRLASDKGLFIVRKDLGVEIRRTQSCDGIHFLQIELYGKEFRPRED